MKDYPYVQNKKKLTNFICDICKKQTEAGFVVEWRVDIFQGNCEFENTCNTCLSNQLNDIKKDQQYRAKLNEERKAKYESIMKPKWDRLERLLAENSIIVRKYPQTGQWVLNEVIDWWTTTGTAIHRKTRQQYKFSVNNPQKIIKTLSP